MRRYAERLVSVFENNVAQRRFRQFTETVLATSTFTIYLAMCIKALCQHGKSENSLLWVFVILMFIKSRISSINDQTCWVIMLFTTFFSQVTKESKHDGKLIFCFFNIEFSIFFVFCVVQDQNKLWQPVDKTLKTLAIELAEFQVYCFLSRQQPP